MSPTLAVLDDSRINAADAVAELTKAGYGDIPIMKLSGQKAEPPFWLTGVR
ncbi:MAG: hypothetical protein K1X67_06655 [Fimbriimonadaceae bacterium]|nr:hypothetical protein [Fimbriimonadaceae bacterium]